MGDTQESNDYLKSFMKEASEDMDMSEGARDLASRLLRSIEQIERGETIPFEDILEEFNINLDEED